MAHLDVPEPDTETWSEPRRQAYAMAERLGAMRRVLTTCPELFVPLVQAYDATFTADGGLARTERELVAAVVAITNRCPTLAEQHLGALRAEGIDDATLEALRRDYRLARLSPRHRALLDYTVLVNEDVHLVSKATLDELMQTHGLQKPDVVLLTHIIGLANHLSRLFTATGH